MSSDSSLSRRRFLQSSTVLGTLALAGCGALGGERTTARPPTTTTTTTTPTQTSTATPDPETPTVRVGDPVTDDAVAMVLEGFTQQSRIRNKTAGDGETFVIVQFVVKNLSSDRFLPAGVFEEFRLVAGEESYTREAVPAASYTQFKAGFIAPGEVVRGFVAFEAPAGVDPRTMGVDLSSDRLTLRQATFQLDARAPEVTILQQDLSVPVATVGESVTDGFRLTVETAERRQSVGGVDAPDGRAFLVVELRASNDSGASQVLNTSTSALVKGGTGDVYPASVRAHGRLPEAFQFITSLSAGATTVGSVPYVVPADADPLYFVFDAAGVGGDGRHFWQV